jgi:cobalt-zinc-cadmium efflux system outer membrane protein
VSYRSCRIHSACCVAAKAPLRSYHRIAAPFVALLALIGSGLSAQEVGPSLSTDQPLTIEALVGAVLEQNPRLRAAEAVAEAAGYRINPAGSLDDPMLSYAAAPLASDQNIEFSQRLPWPGTLSAREAVAEREATAARWAMGSERLLLTVAAKSAYAEWYFVGRALNINLEVQDLVDELIAIAEARYAAGRASRQDVLQAELERVDLENQRLQLIRQQGSVLARINALLNQPPGTSLPLARPIEVGRPRLDTEVLERLAMERHPELGRLHAEIGAAESHVRLARKAFYPDFQIRAGYNTLWDESDKRPVVGVSINIPFNRAKRQAELNRTQAEFRRTEWALEEGRAQLLADLTRSRAEVIESLAAIELYERELVPLASAYLDAALADYRSGTGAFLNVVTAERRQLTTELALERARADYLRRLADLELFAGGTLDSAADAR